MTIEQGIQLCEYNAKTNEILMKRYDDASGYTRSGNAEIRTMDAKTCEKRAEEHSQLAGWLRELKERRKQQTSDDCISRQAVCKIIDDIRDCVSVNGYWAFLERLKKLPPVNPQPKTGHWIGIDEEPHEVWECDHCGFVIDGSGCIDPYDYRDTYKFCPNCGAKMVEPQESEE